MRCRLESIGVSAPSAAGAKQGSLQHAVTAGTAALAASQLEARDIDVLINAGVYRDKHYAEPAFSCFIQKELDINPEFQNGRETLSFDLVNGGCGMLSALDALIAMMEAGRARAGMVIASEANADRHPDASWTYEPSGAALVLDTAEDGERGFGAFAFRTFDQHSDLYSSVVSLAVKRGRLFLRKQAELEQAYLECVPELWQPFLEEAGLCSSDVDLVCASQISPAFVAGLAEALQVPSDRIVDLTGRHGDTLTTSPFLAYAHAQKEGLLAAGRKVAFVTVGSGITVGAAIHHE